jgi:hypothetical protein
MVSKKREGAAWWLGQRSAVAVAVDAAEEATGHQIVVVVGKLGRNPQKIADRIALRNKGASLVFCVDPVEHHYEVRWNTTADLPSEILEQAPALMVEKNLAAVISSFAQALPVQKPGEELPDIIEG